MTDRARVWAAVHAERRALVADLADLTDDGWATPSLCGDWDVHDVVAHLVDVATTTRLGFVRRLLRARFDFDRDNARGVARERRARPADTLARLAEVAERTATPPAPLATRLVEEIVHGEDVRRPLGLLRDYPTDAVLVALRHQLRTAVAWGGGRERVAGRRVVATDADLTVGEGPEVSGPVVSLLVAVSGRPVGPGEVDGSLVPGA